MTYTLITGASGGIGKELAWIAAARGHNLVLVARDEKGLRELADELPAEALAITQDLALPDAADRLAVTLKKQNISVDTLINNAGVGDYGDFMGSDITVQENMLMLNVVTLTKLTRLLLPDIITHKGRVMNLGSVASFLPGPWMSVYFASKAYVLSFSEALSEELKSHGVSVTCLCPGPTATAFGATAHTPGTHATAHPKTTAKQVAAFGWDAMQRGKPVAVYGLGNRLAVSLLPRTLPRSVVRWAMGHGNKGRP